MKTHLHFLRATTQQRFHTARLCRTMCEVMRVPTIPRGNREEPLLSPLGFNYPRLQTTLEFENSS